MSGATYLDALDGLRALAILAVLLFHAGFEAFSGGFLGVDIFFVLSGFLITRNISRDVEAGRWSLGRFYLRRIARLFPALFVTILATLLAGYWLLVPGDLLGLARAAVAATFSVSNFLFWQEAGYFDAAAASKPLLHTWSLSVEEQFYLVWPWLVLLLLRPGRVARVLSLGVLFVLGCGLTALAGWTDPSAAFFMMPTRVFEFTAGAALVFTGADGAGRSSSRWAAAVALAGAVVMVGACLAFAADDTAVVVSGVLVSLGAVAFIHGARTGPVRTVFAWPPLRWLGQRAYSIYLVHWPLMVYFAMVAPGTSGSGVRAGLCLASILAGAVLHRFVERPFRLVRAASGRSVRRSLAVVTAAAGLALATAALWWVTDGLPGRVPPAFRALAEGLNDEWDARQAGLRTGTCNLLVAPASPQAQGLQDWSEETCLRGPQGKPAWLVLGDSYAADAWLILRHAYPRAHFAQVTIPGCRLRLPADMTAREAACRAIYRFVLEEVLPGTALQGVVLASNWSQRHLEEIDALLQALTSRQLDVVLVGQRLRFAERVPAFIQKSPSLAHAQRQAQARVLQRRFEEDAILRERFAGRVRFLSLLGVQCDPQCPVFDEAGRVLYLDETHVSLAGARALAARLSRRQPGFFDAR